MDHMIWFIFFSHHNLIHIGYPAESAWSQKQDFIYFHFSKISRVLFFEMFLTFYMRLKRELLDSILTCCINWTFPIKQNFAKFATSGNRTRASRVAGENSTTEPTLLGDTNSKLIYISKLIDWNRFIGIQPK